jgi:hypothetical protein
LDDVTDTITVNRDKRALDKAKELSRMLEEWRERVLKDEAVSVLQKTIFTKLLSDMPLEVLLTKITSVSDHGMLSTLPCST